MTLPIDIWKTHPRQRVPDEAQRPLLEAFKAHLKAQPPRALDTSGALTYCRVLYLVKRLALHRLDGETRLAAWLPKSLGLRPRSARLYIQIGGRLKPADVQDQPLTLYHLHALTRVPRALRPLLRAEAARGVPYRRLLQMAAALRALPPSDEPNLSAARAALRKLRGRPEEAPVKGPRMPPDLRAALAELRQDPPRPPADPRLERHLQRVAAEQLYDRIYQAKYQARLRSFDERGHGALARHGFGMEPEAVLRHPLPASFFLQEEEDQGVLPFAPGSDDGRLYQPVPVPDLEPVVPLPRAAAPRPLPLSQVHHIGGGTLHPDQFGLVGWHVLTRRPFGLTCNDSTALGLFGPPASGKGYTAGVVVENLLQEQEGLNLLEAPHCVVAMYRSKGYRPELLRSVLPNQVQSEVASLFLRYGARPQGLRDVLVLTLSRRVARMRRENPHCQVHGVRFALRELDLPGLRLLFGLRDGHDSLYQRQVEAMLARLCDQGQELTFNALVDAVEAFRFNVAVRRLVVARLQLARPWIDDREPLTRVLRPGRLVILDLDDAWLSTEQAEMLAALLLRVLCHGTGGDRGYHMTVLIDEFHRWAQSPLVRSVVEPLLRERRHLRLALMLLSQEAGKIPLEILEQLDGFGLFRHDSPALNRRLGKVCRPMGRISAQLTGKLKSSEMILWLRHVWKVTPEAVDQEGTLMLVEVRQRASQHGGASQPAAPEEEAAEER